MRRSTYLGKERKYDTMMAEKRQKTKFSLGFAAAQFYGAFAGGALPPGMHPAAAAAFYGGGSGYFNGAPGAHNGPGGVPGGPFFPGGVPPGAFGGHFPGGFPPGAFAGGMPPGVIPPPHPLGPEFGTPLPKGADVMYAGGTMPPGLMRGTVAGPTGYVYSTSVPERSPNYFQLRKSERRPFETLAA